jgi:hypothetical protein
MNLKLFQNPIYSSSQKYVLIGLGEQASALAGLTIVEASEGSLR